MAPTISENPEWLPVLSYTSLISFPFAVQAAVKLGVFDILSQHGELSAQDIISYITPPISNPRAPLLLDRLLQLLSPYTPGLVHPLLAASISSDSASTAPTTKYSLLPSSKYFLKDDNGVSLGQFWALSASHMLDSFKYLDVVIREGGDGFERSHGHKVSHHVAESAGEMAHIMSSQTALVMNQFLDVYDGFKDVASVVVDVGGSTGSALQHILNKYSHLQGINFDQPHIVEAGVKHPRLKHVGGDMLESIPAGDAVFMKCILHDWEDEDCLKILKNCLKAFTNIKHGKVILLDYFLVSTQDGIPLPHQIDVVMMASHGGKMRTITEYKKLGKDAGFTDAKVSCIINELVVLEYLM